MPRCIVLCNISKPTRHIGSPLAVFDNDKNTLQVAHTTRAAIFGCRCHSETSDRMNMYVGTLEPLDILELPILRMDWHLRWASLASAANTKNVCPIADFDPIRAFHVTVRDRVGNGVRHLSGMPCVLSTEDACINHDTTRLRETFLRDKFWHMHDDVCSSRHKCGMKCNSRPVADWSKNP